MKNKRITLLGATSQIAKGLICNFAVNTDCKLILFARSPDKVRTFLNNNGISPGIEIMGFNEFLSFEYDVLINCVGYCRPSILKKEENEVLSVIEKFDDMACGYLKRHDDCLYINLSSGIVYGENFIDPVGPKTRLLSNTSELSGKNNYTKAKIISENKHRELKYLNIIDIRVFSYFSRFIDLDSGYFLTDIIKCIKDGREFITNSEDIVRDYVGPNDMFLMTKCCLDNQKRNTAYDLYSKEPISKIKVLKYFEDNYGLKYRVEKGLELKSATGSKKNYYSVNKKASEVGYEPSASSMENISKEVGFILK